MQEKTLQAKRPGLVWDNTRTGEQHMTKASKIDPVFTAGAETDPCDKNPYIWSSTNWLLFEAGQLWQNCEFGRIYGRTAPVLARKSRGYTVRVETPGNAFLVAFEGEDLHPRVERI
jgi:hypothetical protein